jgi:antitoxin component YwqK of YwqJK toxin-antitoxin module
MKILYSMLFLLSFASFGQSDSLYSESGQLIRIYPKDLLTAKKSESKGWHENGQLWYVGKYRQGKMVKEITYFVSGEISSIEKNRKYRTKIKRWFANKQLDYVSKNRYQRSVFKMYDSTGVLIAHEIQKKGVSSLMCEIPSNDQITKKDTISDPVINCQCPWGEVHSENGISVDEKGRDLHTFCSSKSTEYYPNGNKKKEQIWTKGVKQQLITEWDEEGNITRTDVYIPGQ